MRLFYLILSISLLSPGFGQVIQPTALKGGMFQIPVGKSTSSTGDAFCLRYDYDGPSYDTRFNLEQMSGVKVKVGNQNPISIHQAQQRDILYLKQDLYDQYHFERGNNETDQPISIVVGSDLNKNIAMPQGLNFNLGEIPDLNINGVDWGSFQEDYWAYQIKKDFFGVDDELKINPNRQLKKKRNSFWDDFKKIREENDFCSSYVDKVCIRNGQIPTVSFTASCGGMDFTFSSEGSMSFVHSVKGDLITISEERSIYFGPEIENSLKEDSCDWDEICISLYNKWVDNPPSISFTNCPIDITIDKGVSVSYEGVSVSLD